MATSKIGIRDAISSSSCEITEGYTGNLALYKSGNVVTIQGYVESSSDLPIGNNNVLATIPQGYRPKNVIYINDHNFLSRINAIGDGDIYIAVQYIAATRLYIYITYVTDDN